MAPHWRGAVPGLLLFHALGAAALLRQRELAAETAAALEPARGRSATPEAPSASNASSPERTCEPTKQPWPRAGAPEARAAELDGTRREARCILAGLREVFADGIRQWPDGNRTDFFSTKGTCAVVSNSGVLKRHRHGRAIDNASVVVRFNEAPIGEVKGELGEPIKNYTAMVGRKEDVRVVNDLFPDKYLQGARPQREPSAYMVMPLSWPPVLPASVGAFARATPAKVYTLSPEAVKKTEAAMHQIFASAWWPDLGRTAAGETTDPQPLDSPSSGLLAGVLVALSCKHSHHYGFPATVQGAWAPYHYYSSLENLEAPTANSLNSHRDFRAEKYLFRLLGCNSDLDGTDVSSVDRLRGEHKECKRARGENTTLPVPADRWERDVDP